MHTSLRLGLAPLRFAFVLFAIALSEIPAGVLGADAAPGSKETPNAAAPSAAIAIAEVKLAQPVNFARDVLPIFRSNCVACHNPKESKGGLVLETPKSIRTGGESGPAALPGKAELSLILKAASHREKPFMPPRNNKVSAVPLTPEQLGLLKLWIDQGAGGDETLRPAPIAWHPLPSLLNPIYAVALSPDGQIAACSRANQIFIYDLPARRLVTRLSDPSLAVPGEQNGVAQRDLVQSLTFSPDGNTLASGGYRDVKFWSRPRPAVLATIGDTHVASSPGALAQNPGGKALAIAGDDRVVRIYSLPAGKLLRELSGHTAAITAIAFADGGASLYSASLDKTLRVWKTSEGAGDPVVIQTPDEVVALAVLGNGQAVTAGKDNVLRIWADGKQLKQLPKTAASVVALAAPPDGGDRFVVACKDGSIRLLDAATEKILRSFDHGGEVSAVSFSADGKRICSVGPNKMARIFSVDANRETVSSRADRDAADRVLLGERRLEFANNEVTFTQNQIQDATTRQNSETQSIARGKTDLAAAEKALADAKKAAEAKAKAKKAVDKEMADADVEIADATRAGDAAMTAATAAKAAVEDFRPTRDKARAAVESATKADAKDAADALALAQKKSDELKAKSDAAAQTQEVARQKLIAATEKRRGIEQRAREAGRLAVEGETLASQAEIGLKSAMKSLTASQASLEEAGKELADGTAARKAADDLVVKSRSDLDAAQKALQTAGSPMAAVAFTADGASVLTAGEDGAIRIWSAETGQPAPTLHGDGAARAVVSICSGSQGLVACATADGTVRIWDVAGQWKLSRTLGNSEASPLASRVCSLAFSPDGTILATGSGVPSRTGELKFWNVADGTLVREIVDAHSDSVLGISFSGDGKYLASCAADRFMKVFTVADGKLFHSYEGTTDQVLGVSFRYDGRTILTGGADNRLRFWNRVTGEQRGQQAQNPFPLQVTSVNFIGVSNTAVITMGDGTLREVTDQGTVRNFEPINTFLYCSAVTPDGQFIIAGGQDSVLRLWDVRSGQPPATFDPPPAQ